MQIVCCVRLSVCLSVRLFQAESEIVAVLAVLYSILLNRSMLCVCVISTDWQKKLTTSFIFFYSFQARWSSKERKSVMRRLLRNCRCLSAYASRRRGPSSLWRRPTTEWISPSTSSCFNSIRIPRHRSPSRPRHPTMKPAPAPVAAWTRRPTYSWMTPTCPLRRPRTRPSRWCLSIRRASTTTTWTSWTACSVNPAAANRRRPRLWCPSCLCICCRRRRTTRVCWMIPKPRPRPCCRPRPNIATI